MRTDDRAGRGTGTRQQTEASRRPKGTGSLSQRNDDGRWIAKLTIDGKPTTRTARTEEEARRLLDALVQQRDANVDVTLARQTLAQYATHYLEHSARNRVRGLTYRTYRYGLQLVTEHIGRIRLEDLRPAHIQRAYSAISNEGLSPANLRIAHRTLVMVLKEATEQGIILKNPASAVKIPRQEPPEQHPLTIEQLRTVLTASEGTRCHALWVVLGTTGLRVGEALALKWTNLREAEAELDVKATVTLTHEGKLAVGQPKTRTSRRTVYLPARTVTALKTHRHYTRLERAASTRWDEQDIIFPNQSGGYQWPSVPRLIWAKLLNECGVAHVRVHDLRHTAATLLLEDGEHMHVVRDLLGHSSVKMTLDLYGHVTPKMQRGAATRMDDLLAEEA